ncbi:MAG TPA: sensor domain-containing protein [Baekduia sp.]|uniref:sensor histidine kinase n=1 Tax=Baekduia sp. TaxID=2600305 RepID=UPI002D77D456|nr:sensor domain-containing protein [Baekduia sp.]HET6506577.1 sensor domain-containing protein [Baekduia sp.]
MLSRIAKLPLTATPWKDLAYVSLGLASGIFGLTWVFVGPVLSLCLIITLIGIPKLYGDVWITRWWCDLERLRGGLAGVPVERSHRTWAGDGFLARLRGALTDPMTWRELVWLALSFGVGTACFVAGVTAWSIGLGFLTLPLWGWALPDGVELGVATMHSVWWMIVFAAITGPPLAILGAWGLRGSAWGQAKLIEVLLEGNEQERIAELQVSRAGAVDAAAIELRRIERDLHDGAQARLVALAMEIGMAREQIERDPEAAAAALANAHEDAKTALVELRDLARGIHPAILTDRGLDAAVSALAARCPVPCTVSLDVPDRMPAAIESAAYFTIAEALANVAKHSGATRCEISGRIDQGMLVVKVHDDGVGGLDAARGTGILGLRGRVEALDGKLLVASPAGKGTLLRAELPCGS